MMLEDSAFDDAFSRLSDAARDMIREFAKWCADNFCMTEGDIDEFGETGDYMRGYNAAMTDGLSGALDCFFDEHPL